MPRLSTIEIPNQQNAAQSSTKVTFGNQSNAGLLDCYFLTKIFNQISLQPVGSGLNLQTRLPITIPRYPQSKIISTSKNSIQQRILQQKLKNRVIVDIVNNDNGNDLFNKIEQSSASFLSHQVAATVFPKIEISSEESRSILGYFLTQDSQEATVLESPAGYRMSLVVKDPQQQQQRHKSFDNNNNTTITTTNPPNPSANTRDNRNHNNDNILHGSDEIQIEIQEKESKVKKESLKKLEKEAFKKAIKQLLKEGKEEEVKRFGIKIETRKKKKKKKEKSQQDGDSENDEESEDEKRYVRLGDYDYDPSLYEEQHDEYEMLKEFLRDLSAKIKTAYRNWRS